MDWHSDKKAPASNFYPTRGRKGRKMTGKPGRDELVRARDAKWLNKWIEAFKLRHQRPPSDEEKYAVMRTGRLRAEYERLSNMNVVVIIDRDTNDMLADGRDPVAYLKESIARMKAEEAARKAEEPSYEYPTEEELERTRRIIKLRVECPVPIEMMRKVRDGKLDRDIVLEAFDLDAKQFAIYYDAMFS